MKKLSFLVTMLMLTVAAHAQWRLGVNVGASRNHASIDKQYMTDVQFRDRWGMTFGVMGQYDFTPWLGLRAEVDWMQKNWRKEEPHFKDKRYHYTLGLTAGVFFCF